MSAHIGTSGVSNPLPYHYYSRQVLSTAFPRSFAPPSHDTSFVAYHVTQVSFTNQLDLAVRAAWASRHRSKYLGVKVLLLSWESDDLGVDDEVTALESVFRDQYHFEVQWSRIPDKSPGRFATGVVIPFIEDASEPDNLVILYYAGHASEHPYHPGGLPTWIAKYVTYLLIASGP